MVRPSGGAPADGDAGDRLDHELVDADGLGEALVVAGADGVTTGSPLGDDPVGDGCARSGACGSSSAACGRPRRVGLELAVLAHEDDEAALGAEERDGVVGHALEQAGMSCSLASSRVISRMRAEAVLARRRRAESTCRRRSTCALPNARAGQVHAPSARRIDGRRRHRGGVRLAQGAAARVVPEDLAQVARELGRRLLEHRQRGVGVPPRRGDAPLRRREPRARIERLPRPLAPRPSLCALCDRRVERAPARPPRPRRASAIAPRTMLRERRVLPEPRVAQADLPPRRARARAEASCASVARLARAAEQPLEARLRRVGRAALRFPHAPRRPRRGRLRGASSARGQRPRRRALASSASRPRSCARAAPRACRAARPADSIDARARAQRPR